MTWPAYVVIDAFNTGNVSNVSEFISPQYFNRESQVDPIRGQLREPAEFTDTVENLKHNHHPPLLLNVNREFYIKHNVNLR
jgi:hypothetical protein